MRKKYFSCLICVPLILSVMSGCVETNSEVKAEYPDNFGSSASSSNIFDTGEKLELSNERENEFYKFYNNGNIVVIKSPVNWNNKSVFNWIQNNFQTNSSAASFVRDIAETDETSIIKNYLGITTGYIQIKRYIFEMVDYSDMETYAFGCVETKKDSRDSFDGISELSFCISTKGENLEEYNYSALGDSFKEEYVYTEQIVPKIIMAGSKEQVYNVEKGINITFIENEPEITDSFYNVKFTVKIGSDPTNDYYSQRINEYYKNNSCESEGYSFPDIFSLGVINFSFDTEDKAGILYNLGGSRISDTLLKNYNFEDSGYSLEYKWYDGYVYIPKDTVATTAVSERCRSHFVPLNFEGVILKEKDETANLIGINASGAAVLGSYTLNGVKFNEITNLKGYSPEFIGAKKFPAGEVKLDKADIYRLNLNTFQISLNGTETQTIDFYKNSSGILSVVQKIEK